MTVTKSKKKITAVKY